MDRRLTRRRLFAIVAGALGATGLAACGQPPAAPTVVSTAPLDNEDRRALGL